MTERVAYGVTAPRYCTVPPYHPDARYPELPLPDTGTEQNAPYTLLRQLLRDLGYDAEHFGTPAWNPLRGIVSPGDVVLIKPNFVLSHNDSGHTLFAVVTHPSIIRAMIDYVYLALAGEGRIIVADAPQMDCDWDELMRHQRLDAVQQLYRERFRFDIELYDLRNFALVNPKQPAYSTNRTALPGDPLGSIVVNLGSASHFHGLANENFYGADYNREVTIRHHQGDTQEYCVSRSVLTADAFISLPKMKVHKKVGVTLNLKGLVGINTDKNYLVHYRLGSPRKGGDQLPDDRSSVDRALIGAQRYLFDIALARQSRWGDLAYRAASSVYRRTIRPWRPVSRSTAILDGGNWYGNDSCWRMTADLLNIIYFVDRNGALRDTPQRRFFCVVDGIIGGENNGPLKPDAKLAGCLVAGRNPLAVDLVTTRLMGFDIRRLRQFAALVANRGFGVSSSDQVLVMSTSEEQPRDRFFDPAYRDPRLGFRPHPGWVGHIEV